LIGDDKNGVAHAGLMIALAKQNLIVEAERFGREAKRFSDNPDVQAAAGFVCYTHSKSITKPSKRNLYLETAGQLCESAIKDNPNSVVAHRTLGLIRLAQDELKEAIAPFRRSVALAETPENLTNLAHVLVKTAPGDKEGEELITKTLSLNKDYYPAHLEKAIVLLNKGGSKDAFGELNEIPNAERNAQWSLVAGDIYCKQGDRQSAFASWHNAARLDPFLPDAYHHMAEYYASHGKDELAVTELFRGLDVLPDNRTLREQLVNIARKSHKVELKLERLEIKPVPNLELDPGMSFGNQHPFLT
jgi:tetratricopeptide (TPR) repeat protein